MAGGGDESSGEEYEDELNEEEVYDVPTALKLLEANLEPEELKVSFSILVSRHHAIGRTEYIHGVRPMRGRERFFPSPQLPSCTLADNVRTMDSRSGAGR